MKLYTIYFLFALFTSNLLFAQQSQFVLPLPGDIIPLTDGDTTGQFDLIDLAGDSLILGYLPVRDEGNERQPIVTPIKKSDWLRAIISDKTVDAFSNHANPLLYVLNDISVGRTGVSNYVRIQATVYERVTSGYTLLAKIDTLITDRAKDISKIGDLINIAIGSTTSLLNTGIFQNPEGPGLTKEEVIKQENEKYAFISNGINPSGIYMNYEEYKANKPALGQFFIKTDIASKTIEINSFSDVDSTLSPVKPWAVAANNELYVFNGNKLYPVEALGNNLVFSKFLDPDTRKNNAMFWRMTVGDNFPVKYNNIFDNVNTLIITNYRSKKLIGEAIKINADTGTPEF